MDQHGYTFPEMTLGLCDRLRIHLVDQGLVKEPMLCVKHQVFSTNAAANHVSLLLGALVCVYKTRLGVVETSWFAPHNLVGTPWVSGGHSLYIIAHKFSVANSSVQAEEANRSHPPRQPGLFWQL